MIKGNYLGWVGHDNLGDEILRDVYTTNLPQLELRSLPLDPRRYPLAAPSVVRGLRSPLVVGGGTIIGRSNWRWHFNLARYLSKGPALFFGAGVEDPNYDGRFSFGGHDELAKWPRVLQHFDGPIGVRGPDSVGFLEGVGVESFVIGDPALSLPVDNPWVEEASEDEVAVCLGFGDSLFGGDHTRVEAAVCEGLAVLGPARVRILQASPADAEISHRLERTLRSAGVPVIVESHSRAGSYMRAVASAKFLIAERLHAVVLGVLSGVPTLALAYQPKVLDFMRSLHVDEGFVQTDVVTASHISDGYGVVSSSEHRVKLREAVQGYRADQARFMAGWVRTVESTS